MAVLAILVLILLGIWYEDFVIYLWNRIRKTGYWIVIRSNAFEIGDVISGTTGTPMIVLWKKNYKDHFKYYIKRK